MRLPKGNDVGAFGAATLPGGGAIRKLIVVIVKALHPSDICVFRTRRSPMTGIRFRGGKGVGKCETHGRSGTVYARQFERPMR